MFVDEEFQVKSVKTQKILVPFHKKKDFKAVKMIC